MKRLLTIAGSDSGGAAGIQADLKTFQAFGCYGMSALTAVTAQNTCGVQKIIVLEAPFVAQQIESVLSDIGADAVKLGMLGNADIVAVVAKMLRDYPVMNVVVDPVLYSTGGSALLEPEARTAFVQQIVPLATVLTPNIPEAEMLSGITIRNLDDMKRAAESLKQLGAANVLVKGGHRDDDATDILFDGRDYTEFFAERVKSNNTHGTGCTFAAAIAANLALGETLPEAISISKKFVTAAIREGLNFGHGKGSLNHFVSPEEIN